MPDDEQDDVAPPQVEQREDRTGDQDRQRRPRPPQGQVHDREGGQRDQARQPWPAGGLPEGFDGLGAIQPFFT